MKKLKLFLLFMLNNLGAWRLHNLLKSQLVNSTTRIALLYISSADDLKENWMTITKGICMGRSYIVKHRENDKTGFKTVSSKFASEIYQVGH